MPITSKKISLFILFVTSLICSRTMFYFFDDPEGPNLLIVTVMAAILYFLSLSAFLLKTSERKKLLLSVCIQVLIATGLCIYLNTTQNNEDKMTADTAVMLVKKTYPQYADYPSDNLPPKSVEVVGVEEGFRVGMYVHGSGLPGILQANCFLITKLGGVTESGFFNGEGPATSINLQTCTPKE